LSSGRSSFSHKWRRGRRSEGRVGPLCASISSVRVSSGEDRESVRHRAAGLARKPKRSVQPRSDAGRCRRSCRRAGMQAGAAASSPGRVIGDHARPADFGTASSPPQRPAPCGRAGERSGCRRLFGSRTHVRKASSGQAGAAAAFRPRRLRPCRDGLDRSRTIPDFPARIYIIAFLSHGGAAGRGEQVGNSGIGMEISRRDVFTRYPTRVAGRAGRA
jgi:hypothetical protein